MTQSEIGKEYPKHRKNTQKGQEMRKTLVWFWKVKGVQKFTVIIVLEVGGEQQETWLRREAGPGPSGILHTTFRGWTGPCIPQGSH